MKEKNWPYEFLWGFLLDVVVLELNLLNAGKTYYRDGLEEHWLEKKKKKKKNPHLMYNTL